MKTTLLFLSVFLSVNLFGQTQGTGVTDIDGNSYETVIIGNQEWMAENLKTSSYSNGESILNIPDSDTSNYYDFSYQTITSGAWTYYKGNYLYENPYGKLYNWYAVEDARNLCPAGWDIPTSEQVNQLYEYLGGESIAGGKMKSEGLEHWNYPNTGASNSSGFSALPGGQLGNDGFYCCEGSFAAFWTSSQDEFDFLFASCFGLNWNTEEIITAVLTKQYLFSIRCLKADPSSLSELTTSKNLIQILDMMGRETSFKPNTPLIYVYDDGSTEKVFSVEY